MQHHHRLPQAPRRLQRFILWAALWLAWAGEVTAGVMKRFRAGHKLEARIAQMLPRIAVGICGALLIEALVINGRATFLAHKRFFTSKQKLRALLGTAIRRRLRGESVGERIARLASIMKHRTAIVARIARRIAHGLTQGTINLAPAPIVRAYTTPALAHAGVDSS